ncbi:MAG: helix-turn-helix domain-containing protein [Methylophilaceae bacterium]|jgi:Fis family transcriptional regulator|nr:Fis family transcriptional regulator [Methylophilaceae bacterium]
MSGATKLGECIKESLDSYFTNLEGEQPHAIYGMVLDCVEKPMLEYILNKVGGNQSKAAEILGINRNTLRKKMAAHNLD